MIVRRLFFTITMRSGAHGLKTFCKEAREHSTENQERKLYSGVGWKQEPKTS